MVRTRVVRALACKARPSLGPRAPTAVRQRWQRIWEARASPGLLGATPFLCTPHLEVWGPLSGCPLRRPASVLQGSWGHTVKTNHAHTEQGQPPQHWPPAASPEPSRASHLWKRQGSKATCRLWAWNYSLYPTGAGGHPRSPPEGRCGRSWAPSLGYPPPLRGVLAHSERPCSVLSPARVPAPPQSRSGSRQPLPSLAPRGRLRALTRVQLEREVLGLPAPRGAEAPDPCADGAQARGAATRESLRRRPEGAEAGAPGRQG